MDDPSMFRLRGLVVTGSRCLAVVTTTHFVRPSLLIEIDAFFLQFELDAVLIGCLSITINGRRPYFHD